MPRNSKHYVVEYRGLKVGLLLLIKDSHMSFIIEGKIDSSNNSCKYFYSINRQAFITFQFTFHLKDTFW